jgi:hypothetical protein
MLKGLMTRLVLITTLLVLGLAGPASAKLTVGIGEQNAQMFTDGRWMALKAPHVRYVMPWDAIARNGSDLAVLDNYMYWARLANARVLLSFGHFIREFRKFRRRYPEVKTFQTWNEGNHGTQPTFTKPGRAALLYNSMRRTCPECTITAPSMLDAPNMTPWIKAFKRKTRYPVRIWAIHNHIDANRHRTSGTRELLRRPQDHPLQPEERGPGHPQRVQARPHQPQADHARLHVQLDRAERAPPAVGLGPGRS